MFQRYPSRNRNVALRASNTICMDFGTPLRLVDTDARLRRKPPQIPRQGKLCSSGTGTGIAPEKVPADAGVCVLI